MLIDQDSTLYAYAITRDLGFAPNPFHGVCTLATCKPGIRRVAQVNDWILGVGGHSLGNAYRKCILLMKVTEKLDFKSYWNDSRFEVKKPCRNGSRVRMLGDNIYHQGSSNNWIQEDSHHSNQDGSVNIDNLDRDTGRTDSVLISTLFFYFGEAAVPIDLDAIGYNRVRDYIKKDLSRGLSAQELILNIYNANKRDKNIIVANPCQFKHSSRRVDQVTGKFI